MNRYWVLFLVAMVGVLIAIITFRAVYRDVSGGSFNEFTIGESKQKVLSTIFDVIGASAISADLKSSAVIKASNIEQVYSLHTAEKIILRDALGFVLEFEIRSGRVSELRVSDVRSIQIAISEDQPISTALEQLKEYLQAYPETIAFESVAGYGPGGKMTEVLKSELERPIGVIAVDWLMKKDTWSFWVPDSYKRYTLHFNNNALSRIIYWNTFGELP